MRTIVYIDGFNFYFGSLKNTPHKWLDICALVSLLCKEQNPASNLVQIKYFTADIKAKLAKRGVLSCEAQQDYLLALQAYSPIIEIIKGKYFVTKGTYHPFSEPVDFNKKLEVWKAEEKHTDVSIALHMLCDAMDKKCNQIVLFSNDSDLSPALEMTKKRHPEIKIGIITPGLQGERKPSADLKAHSDWLRHGIRCSELEKCQLPSKIITRKRKITKPEHW